MSIPEQPSTFRPATPAERPWWWLMEDREGAEVTPEGDLAVERFSNQADAESWIGETYTELAGAGVDQVTLFELDRKVYGPMSLHAD